MRWGTCARARWADGRSTARCVLAEAKPDDADALPPGAMMKGPPSFEFVASDGVPEVRARIAATPMAEASLESEIAFMIMLRSSVTESKPS